MTSTTLAQRRAKQTYERKFKKITIRLNLDDDYDMLQHLFMQASMTEYIKGLIRKDMLRGKTNF